MAAPTSAARVKKPLANPEPSTHGPTLPSSAVQQVGSYLRCTGRSADVVGKAAFDPKRPFALTLSCKGEKPDHEAGPHPASNRIWIAYLFDHLVGAAEQH